MQEVTDKKLLNQCARTRARQWVVQALYQWLVSPSPVEDIIDEFINQRPGRGKTDTDYFKKLFIGTVKYKDTLNQQLGTFLDRRINDLDPVTQAILLLGMRELNAHADVPYRVVLDEAIDLAKKFGAEQSHKYINGVLDKAVKINRATEKTS